MSLGNVHNTIRNRVNGLTKKLCCSQTSRGSCVDALIYVYVHSCDTRLKHSCMHTWYSLSNPLSLSLCMALTCSEKSDLCTGSDGRVADSTVKVTKSIHTIKYSRDIYMGTQSSASKVKIQFIPHSGTFLYEYFIMVKHMVHRCQWNSKHCM